MARVKALMLGVDSLTYKYFMKCEARALLTLLDSTYRGVTENRDFVHPASAWATVLAGKPVKVQGYMMSPINLKVVEESGAVLINIPITNPTAGRLNIPMDSTTPLEAEVDAVTTNVLEAIEEAPVVAAITGLERLQLKDLNEICQAYRVIDGAIRKLVMKADEFIVFSPYGPRSGGTHDPYGVYLATRPRPNEHDTVKLWEIGDVFINMVK